MRNLNLFAITIISTIQAFTIYPSISGKVLLPDVAFSALALFNTLMIPMWSLPLTISNMVNAIVSTRRLTAFLMAPEVRVDEGGEEWHLLEDEDEDEDEDEEQVII